MTEPRTLLTLVCNADRPHTLARVVADTRGPLLVIEHTPIGVVPRPGETVRVDRTHTGGKVSVLLNDEAGSWEASCACSHDFDIHPTTVRAELAAGHRRVVLCPITY